MRGALFLFLGFMITGCNLPGIPLDLDGHDTEPDSPRPQVGEIVCEAQSRTCVGSAVHVCSDDGTDFDVRPCLTDETCAVDQCLPVENTCDRGQPFALSHQELVYPIKSDFKAQTQEVVLSNCGASFVFLDHVVVRGPVRPDGDPVFALTDDSKRSVRLEAGQSTTLRVTYRPANGLAQVLGQLDLGLVTDGYSRLSVPLRVSSVCVTAAPQIQLGAYPNTADPPVVWLQNCGTEPVYIDEVGSHGIDLTPLDKLPHRLEAGQHFGTLLALPSVGEIRERVTFTVRDQPSVSTAVLGVVVDPEECTFEVSPSQLAVAASGSDGGELEVTNSLEVVALRDVAVLVPNSPAGEAASLFEIVSAPPGEQSEVIAVDGDGVYRPLSIGTTEISYRLIDQDGQRSCNEEVVQIEARPEGDLWVELTWDNVGDLIPTDAGFGRGTDLNLHVLAQANIHSFQSAWDCSAHSDYNCAQETGQVLQTSLAGDRPEVIRFMALDGAHDVGVYLSNPFNFGGAQARVRVFYKGELLDERTRLLTVANEFWWVGRVDDGAWTKFDSVFNGFPR